MHRRELFSEIVLWVVRGNITWLLVMANSPCFQSLFIVTFCSTCIYVCVCGTLLLSTSKLLIAFDHRHTESTAVIAWFLFYDLKEGKKLFESKRDETLSPTIEYRIYFLYRQVKINICLLLMLLYTDYRW